LREERKGAIATLAVRQGNRDWDIKTLGKIVLIAYAVALARLREFFDSENIDELTDGR